MIFDTCCLCCACFVCVRLLNLTGWMIILSGLDQDTDLCSIPITCLLTWLGADESTLAFIQALRFLNPINFSVQKSCKICLLGTDLPNFKHLPEGVISKDPSLLLKKTGIFRGQCKLPKSSLSPWSVEVLWTPDVHSHSGTKSYIERKWAFVSEFILPNFRSLIGHVWE